MNLLDRWLRWVGTRRGGVGSIVAVGVLGGVWTLHSAAPPASTTGGQIPNPRQGFLAPAFTSTDVHGEELRLSGLRGQVVVLNFWASWCPPCRAEMPSLQHVYDTEAARGLVVLGINATFEDDRFQAVAFAAQRSVTFPVLLDQSGEVNHQYQVRALPTTFVIDRQGVIRQVIVGGPLAESSLRSLVQTLLAESP
jgi:cytochrome c biogenesis protein CcmG/thiol:disulfide interchange protein DsbE